MIHHHHPIRPFKTVLFFPFFAAYLTSETVQSKPDRKDPGELELPSIAAHSNNQAKDQISDFCNEMRLVLLPVPPESNTCSHQYFSWLGITLKTRWCCSLSQLIASVTLTVCLQLALQFAFTQAIYFLLLQREREGRRWWWRWVLPWAGTNVLDGWLVGRSSFGWFMVFHYGTGLQTTYLILVFLALCPQKWLVRTNPFHEESSPPILCTEEESTCKVLKCNVPSWSQLLVRT